MFGIEAMEIYVPRTYVDQSELQTHDKVGSGKYTKGLGQLGLSFAYPFEDVNSMSLTVVRDLMRYNNILPSQVGRLEIGTETLVDKSKSTKTHLMTLFENNHDIEGATSLNACYGGTNALINTLNWISSPSWDGRYGIVVATDIAVYEEGPARPTGGAGAVALLIGRNPKITFGQLRASFMEHKYDFYKPVPQSQYPYVDGKLSMECYIRAMEQCYQRLKEKQLGKNLLADSHYVCFHTPFAKMIQKAFKALSQLESKNVLEEQIETDFAKKVESSLYISRRVGNIYTGSLFAGLISLLVNEPQIQDKNTLLFSYGSGLCSTLLQARIHKNPLSSIQISRIKSSLNNRMKISPERYTQVMKHKESVFGKFRGKIDLDESLLSQNTFYLAEIDDKWRRTYKLKSSPTVEKKLIAMPERLQALQEIIDYPSDRNRNRLSQPENLSPMKPLGQNYRFHKLSVNQRRSLLNLSESYEQNELLDTGGLDGDVADSMIENVIGKVAIPLGVIPTMVINRKKYVVPLAIEQPSVVAACSSISKLISPFSFFASSTPSIMIGQVHLPCAEISEVHEILSSKNELIKELNLSCQSMVNRGGGVKDIRVRELKGPLSKQYAVDVLINVCDAMGANITNTVTEKAKELLSKKGIRTGIAILSNYCTQRKAVSWFELPVDTLSWKGFAGKEVAEKILEAYDFARGDRYRAATHNKGIMNGIDAVCIATGQDWRAVESAVHCYASRSGQYMPLSHFELFTKEGKIFFKGRLELPISVGSRGGCLEKNSLYKLSHHLLGNPSAQQLSQIIVTVGLAQNFAALRALAIEGIQKGHMMLHARAMAAKLKVPSELIEECSKYMASVKRYDPETVQQFLRSKLTPKL